MCRLVMVGIPLINTARGPVARYVRLHPVVSVFFVIMIGCGVATLVFPQTEEVAGFLGYMLGISGAGVSFLRGARKLEGRERLTWSTLGGALLLATAGLVVLTVVSSLGYEVPAFGPIDSIFIASYILVCVAVVIFPTSEGRWSIRVLGLVDGLVGAVAVATVAWVWFLSGYLHLLAGATVGQRLIAMTYPIIDITILITVLMISARRSSYRFDPRLLLLSIGLIFQAAADITFAASGVGALFVDAKPIFALNIAAGLFFLATASIIHLRPAPREFADRPTKWTTLIAPYGAAGAMVLGLVWHAVKLGSGHVLLLVVSTMSVVILTFLRQAVSIREYRYRVDEDRQNLVSSISHELRTPLTSMVGMLELMRIGDDRLSKEEHQEFLETVTDQARYMGRIVSDLMVVARDLDGSIRVVPTAFALNPLIKAAVSHVEGSQAVEIRVPAITVVLDGDRVQQAVANMVANAVKYGGGRVLVTARQLGEDLVIEVHDDGPGVPIKFELVIWNRFERGPRKLDSRIPGSGIGLAIVAKVAKAHGGHSGYRRSERLQGSCFFLSIPAQVAPREVPWIGPDPVGRIAV